jgi:hypothetical protein
MRLGQKEFSCISQVSDYGGFGDFAASLSSDVLKDMLSYLGVDPERWKDRAWIHDSRDPNPWQSIQQRNQFLAFHVSYSDFFRMELRNWCIPFSNPTKRVIRIRLESSNVGSSLLMVGE